VKAHIVNESDVIRSGRVMQVEGLFDVPPSKKARLEWDVELPIEDKPWSVGLIVGPSGAGKTSIARQMFSKELVEGFDWSPDRAVLDEFPAEMATKEVVKMLTAVGFGSPPAWMRPFSTLSNGEQFRVTMARAMAEQPDLAVIDEFTSVVDRQVAKVASHAVAKTIRRSGRKLVALSCHYDIVDWLQPDWIYLPHERSFSWRSVQPRPELELRIHQVDRSVWKLFAQHHYLSSSLKGDAKCFGAFIGDEIVAFTSHTNFPHPKVRNIRHGHRLVVLPDWQGLGIAGRLDDWLGQYLWERGYRYRNVVAHPAMIAFYQRSPRWQFMGKGGNMRASMRNKSSGKNATSMRSRHLDSRSLNIWSFEYKPPLKTAS
jgi:ABC-type Mn2+/Zn2+ transport system ATPase subunit